MAWLWGKKKVAADSSPVISKIPAVGDQVWWASKGIGGVVTSRDTNNCFVFQGGELVTNKKGRVVPRWTVQTRLDTAVWKEDIKMWIVGHGPTPKKVREVIIKPEPVSLSGQAKGSFAVRK